MFWNVENLFDIENDPNNEDDEYSPDSYLRWNDRVYTYKIEQISRLIRQQDPILNGLAEVANIQVLEDLTVALHKSG
jgi:hypothetical protein